MRRETGERALVVPVMITSDLATVVEVKIGDFPDLSAAKSESMRVAPVLPLGSDRSRRERLIIRQTK